MDDFAGTIVHPQAWPDDIDVIGKRIVVIGSGATAVTLVPALARSAAHVTMLQRSPTYIASLPEKSPVVALLRKVLPAKQAGVAAKWFHALMTQAFYQVSRRYPQLVRRLLLKGLERQLPPGYDIGTHFTPRTTRGTSASAPCPTATSSSPSARARPRWSPTASSASPRRGSCSPRATELEADIIVTATGLELLFLGGIALSVDGETVDPGPASPTRG